MEKVDPTVPPGLHLIAAFNAMEPTHSLISLARDCGGGLLTETVQRFVWDHCITPTAEKGPGPYVKRFLKKLISEIESSNGVVLDELYEQYSYYMTLKEDKLVERKARISKCISFLFPGGSTLYSAGCHEFLSCLKSSKLVVPLHCSLNMLEGDTGCSIWPSSLYLSEFILSFPDIFSEKSCFEVGSGVGLVGISLSHVKASESLHGVWFFAVHTASVRLISILHAHWDVTLGDEAEQNVILSDGDMSTLANMKLNLELNQLRIGTGYPEGCREDSNVVKCIHLPWESATENELKDFKPDIVLGADIIYDPSWLPDLVRVLTILLNHMKSYALLEKQKHNSPSPDGTSIGKVNGCNDGSAHSNELKESDHDRARNQNENYVHQEEELVNGSSDIGGSKKRPVAYIASVIRNADTFNYFLELAEKANLVITDLTETFKPLNLLPYMQSYNRSSIRLFAVTCT